MKRCGFGSGKIEAGRNETTLPETNQAASENICDLTRVGGEGSRNYRWLNASGTVVIR